MKKSTKNILTAFLLNFFFVIIELVGGILTNSMAILSDSIHDAGDCLSIALAFMLEKKSNKKSDKVYTYGYRRYSVVSAMITSSILLVGSVVVIYSSILRIINPEPIKGLYMFIIAIFGVVINGLAVLKTAKSKNINEKSINLHMLEDVLGWIVVLIGSIFVWLFDFYILDPILSILVTIYVLYHALSNLIYAISIVLEKIPKGFKFEEYAKALENIEKIKSIHHLHVWTLDGENMLATFHIVVENALSKEEITRIKCDVKQISKTFEVEHITIQVDYETENCEDNECEISTEEIEHEHNHHHHHHHDHNHQTKD